MRNSIPLLTIPTLYRIALDDGLDVRLCVCVFVCLTGACDMSRSPSLALPPLCD